MKKGTLFLREGGLELHVTHVVRLNIVLYKLTVIIHLSLRIIGAQAHAIVFKQIAEIAKYCCINYTST